MNIGFDMDGVLCKIDVALLRLIDNMPDEVRKSAEEWYYRQRPPELNASLFLHEDDKMFIITSRPRRLARVTGKWVKKFYPYAHLYFAPYDTLSKWQNSEEQVVNWLIKKQATKAVVINELEIDVYFDDDCEVSELRKLCPNTKIVKYGDRI